MQDGVLAAVDGCGNESMRVACIVVFFLYVLCD